MASDLTNEMIIEQLQKIINDYIGNGTNIDKIIKYTESDSFIEMYEKVIELISNNAVKTIDEIMYEKVIENRAFTQEFLARQEQKWGKAFIASEALYVCVLESSEAYTDYISENLNVSDEMDVFYALQVIHARACQEYLEILTLNRSGFADGAYARWRSMYELSITSAFIKKYGKKVAKSFLEAADSDDRYEWARKADCFKNYNKRYMTFAAIQKECEFATKVWRDMYNLSNQVVHASPQGTVYRVGNKKNINALSVGHSDYGVSISAINSAISLTILTSDFLSLYPHGDSIVAISAFNKWIGKIKEYYRETEEMCFSDDSYHEIK